MSLADVWFALLGFIFFLALALDGLDLGIGFFTLFCRDEAQRATMLNAIGPVWHANLTWLVVVGGLLFGAFPLAYGVVLSALYLPLAVMLLGLIFRGISFEFREEARRKLPWNLGFGLGSLTATLARALSWEAWSAVFGFREGSLPAGFGIGFRLGRPWWPWVSQAPICSWEPAT